MDQTKIQAFVWDEHGEPQEVSLRMGFSLLQHDVRQHLETKEYGKIVKTFSDAGDELVLHYRAFTDEHRGRIIACGTDLADLDASYREQKRLCALRVFSPAELYALKHARTDFGSYHTVTVHFREEVSYFDLDLDAIQNAQRMETRTLVDHCSDGRRTWTLQTIWFDGKPVMVVNSSGRDGDENHERWITDSPLFAELVAFLRSFSTVDKVDMVEASAKIPGMTEFYGGTIHDHYDVDAQESKNK